MNLSSNLQVNPLPTNFSNLPAGGDVMERVENISPLASDDESSSLPLKGRNSLDLKPAKAVAEKLQEKKKRRKKKWKKPKDKPTRPLSAYNFFFQSQRSEMLGADAPSKELETLKKRVHCKTHGKIGFAEMARAIGAKWKALAPEERKVYEDQARKEKERYILELSTWKEVQKDKSAATDQNNGLDAMAAAAMASSPINSEFAGMRPQTDGNKVGESLRMAMVDGVHRRNLQMMQQRPQNLDYIRALQDRQLGLSNFNSSLMNYPSAAEASASALLKHFQNVNQTAPSPGHGISHLTFQPNPHLAAMRHLQYMSAGRFGSGDGICR